MEVPEKWPADNGKKPCLVNHRVQTTFRFLRLEILDMEGLILNSGERAGL